MSGGGWVGWWCVDQASASCMCECTAVVLVVCVSLCRRLRNAADDLHEENNHKKEGGKNIFIHNFSL